MRTVRVISALAAAFVIGLAVVLLMPRPTADPGHQAVVRGAGIQLLSPADRIGRDAVFTWSSPVQADHFRLVFLDVSSGLVYATTTRAERLQPSAELWAALRPSQIYTWSVEAFDAEGRPVARSADKTFTFAPPR